MWLFIHEMGGAVINSKRQPIASIIDEDPIYVQDSCSYFGNDSTLRTLIGVGRIDL